MTQQQPKSLCEQARETRPSPPGTDEGDFLNCRMLPPSSDANIAYLLSFFPIPQGSFLIPPVKVGFPLHLEVDQSVLNRYDAMVDI